MLAISPPDDHSSICTLLSVGPSTWEEHCAASVIEMTSSTGTVSPILDTYSAASTVGHLDPLHPRNPAQPCLSLVCSHQCAEGGMCFSEEPSTTGVQWAPSLSGVPARRSTPLILLSIHVSYSRVFKFTGRLFVVFMSERSRRESFLDPLSAYCHVLTRVHCCYVWHVAIFKFVFKKAPWPSTNFWLAYGDTHMQLFQQVARSFAGSCICSNLFRFEISVYCHCSTILPSIDLRSRCAVWNHVATRVDPGHGFCGSLLAPQAQRPAPQAWWFIAGSWSPATGSSSPAVLQRPAHQVRRFCRCRLWAFGHVPAPSLAPHRPRRVQDSEKTDKRGKSAPPFITYPRLLLTKPRLSESFRRQAELSRQIGAILYIYVSDTLGPIYMDT